MTRARLQSDELRAGTNLRSLAVFARILLRRPWLVFPSFLLIAASWVAPWVVREEGGARWVLRLIELWGNNTALALFWPSAAVTALALGLMISDLVRKEVDRGEVLLIPTMRGQLLALTLWAGIPVALGVAYFVPDGTALPQQASLGALTLLVYLHGAARFKWAHAYLYLLWLSLNVMVLLWPVPFLVAVSAAPLLSGASFLLLAALIWRAESVSDYRRSHAVLWFEVREDTTDLDLFPESPSAKTTKKAEADEEFKLWPTGPAGSSLHSFVRATRHEGSAFTLEPGRIVVSILLSAVVLRIIDRAWVVLFFTALANSLRETTTPRLLHLLSRDMRANVMFAIAMKRTFGWVVVVTIVAYVADMLAFLPILLSSPSTFEPTLFALAIFAAAPLSIWIRSAMATGVRTDDAGIGTELRQFSVAFAAFLVSLPLVKWFAHYSAEHGASALMLLTVLIVALTWGLLYIAIRWRMNSRDLALTH